MKYVDGFVVAVPADKKDAVFFAKYRTYGALFFLLLRANADSKKGRRAFGPCALSGDPY